MGKHDHHHHIHHEYASSKKLYIAVFVNLLLTVFQVFGAIVSGSLSLMADALHNFSDAGALVIAAIAAKIAKIPANQRMTYGYRRAEILGALINSTTLVIVGFYLIYEAITRYFEQNLIDGWTVVIVATIALVVDLITALLTYSGSKESVNIRAAFVHNLSDAAASVVVIVSGILIINFKVYIVDLVATGIISVYVLYQAFFLIRQCILILMQSTPSNVEISKIKESIESIALINEVHHIHVWQMDDKRLFLEAHLVLDIESLISLEKIKKEVKELLKVQFAIDHSTLEIETLESCPDC